MALTLPLLLTVILFLGPLAMLAATDRLKWFFRSAYWKESITDWVWWRNHIVAPVSEEFAFR
jgi:prenyl protein peptidase